MSKTPLRSLKICYPPVEINRRYYFYEGGPHLRCGGLEWSPSTIPLSLVRYNGRNEPEFGQHFVTLAKAENGGQAKILAYSWVHHVLRWKYPNGSNIIHPLTDYFIIVHSNRLEKNYRYIRIKEICFYYGEFPSVVSCLEKQTTKMLDGICHLVDQEDRRYSTEKESLDDLAARVNQVQGIWDNSRKYMGTRHTTRIKHGR